MAVIRIGDTVVTKPLGLDAEVTGASGLNNEYIHVRYLPGQDTKMKTNVLKREQLVKK